MSCNQPQAHPDRCGCAEARERLRQRAQNEQTVIGLNNLLHYTEKERDALRAELDAIRQGSDAGVFLPGWSEIIPIGKKPVAQQPVAWRHTIHMDGRQRWNEFTGSKDHPFGTPGVDFDASYAVTTTPLYEAPPAEQPDTVPVPRDTLARLFAAFDAEGENPDPVMDELRALLGKEIV